ncbi:MAG: NADH-quinone oxidoreductase subunit NuoG [Solirubrobacteraceae bacterium]
MPRPEQKIIKLTIDGREVEAVEGTMLVDAARAADVEIPYFCYEPKLGQPVGACRMCLVEIEGIPKLQTSCSTGVREGMVVNTKVARVKEAQNSVLEFLLVNHPLDCPVCDKGGECPLQDITFGWGRGQSRVVEPKRHYVKPLALSPLIAIDRERCILCYRCVRFSQEVAEDWQLIFTERGSSTYVGTHDGHPYVAPFSGNIVELCPVGALTSRPYRFRARPWDIEKAAGICTLCPAQCNVEFTVRDEQVVRVLSRENPGVDDGWLCDKGRFAYQAIHVDERVTTPLVRDGSGELRSASWDEALTVAATGLSANRGRIGALVGGQATNEEAFLLARLLREGLDCTDIDSRLFGTVELGLARALAAPALQANVQDLEFAHTVLVLGTEPVDDAPILDLRIRKGVRRHGVKLILATPRPSSLDANAKLSLRYSQTEARQFLTELSGALDGGAASEQVAEIAAMLRGGGEDIVILWGESIGQRALPMLLRVAEQLGLAGRDGAGLLEVPTAANGRGIREAGAVPNAKPGYTETAKGRNSLEIAQAAAAGELSALYLFGTEPLRDQPWRAGWEAALTRASFVVAHAFTLSEGVAAHADVIFPAESNAEKEGTVVHPDGRLQRLRQAIRRPGQVRAGWQVLADLAKLVGFDMHVHTAAMAFKQLTEAVPFYAGITLDQIAGRGVRWPELDSAGAMPAGSFDIVDGVPAAPASGPAPEVDAQGRLRVATYRSIWAAPEVEVSPALHFTIAQQLVELSPQDARRLGIEHGAPVLVAQNGNRVSGIAQIRTGVPVGTVFLATGIAEQSANALSEPLVEVTTA